MANFPGCVRMRPSPTFTSPWKSDSMPVEMPGGSSPSLSNAAERMTRAPVGTGSAPHIFWSAPRPDLLPRAADEVVDVVQPVVLDVERVPAEVRAVGEEHALRTPVRQVHD